MILSPGQPIPYNRPYRYHPNGLIHMMTARKRVGPFLVPQLAVRHPVDHYSSNYFSPDDSARDSSPDSSSEASSDFHSDASSDSSSGHSLSDHSSPDLSSTYARPSRKRRRMHEDNTLGLARMSSTRKIKIQAEINECIAYADALRDRGIDARVVHDPSAIPVHRIQAIEGVQREHGHRIVGVESAVTNLTERVAELERDNKRLSDTVSVESQRVDRLQHDMSRMQREKMPNTRFGASMTHEEVEELVTRRVAEEMEAQGDVVRTEEMEMEEMEEMEMEGMEKTKMEIEMEIMNQLVLIAAYAMNRAGTYEVDDRSVTVQGKEIQKMDD
ncbi:putative reverse transcriptase domain-containing protein [Tanacetum coccineum]